MKKLENIKNIFYGVVMLAFLAPTILGARVYAATETQKEDVKKNSALHDEENTLPCLSGASGADISAGDISGSGSKIGYVSGLEGPYILEQFIIHSLKALAVAKGVPETDVLTEEHVVGLAAFSFGEGGDINNSNIFNPLNHGKVPGDGGIATGDVESGHVKYATFDEGVDANARVLNGQYQQRIAAVLTNKDTTSEDVIHAFSYHQFYVDKGFTNDKAWAGKSEPGIVGNSSADAYHQEELGFLTNMRASYDSRAALVIGTDALEQGAGTVIPSKLTYHPAGSSTGATDSDISVAGGGGGAAGSCAGSAGGGPVTIVGEKAFPLAISSKSQLSNANLFHDNTYERGTHGTYEAIDLMVGAGTPVKALISGTVKRISTDRCGGALVTVLSENQGDNADEVIMVSYMHMDKASVNVTVSEGKQLNFGDPIGSSGDGSVGFDTAHLHIDAIKGDVKLACSRNACPAEEAAKYIDLGPTLFTLFQAIPD